MTRNHYLVSASVSGCESTADFLVRVIFKSHRMEVGIYSIEIVVARGTVLWGCLC